MIQFKITEKELLEALEFAKEYGDSNFNTVTMGIGESTGLGKGITVRSDTKTKPKDITNYEAW